MQSRISTAKLRHIFKLVTKPGACHLLFLSISLDLFSSGLRTSRWFCTAVCGFTVEKSMRGRAHVTVTQRFSFVQCLRESQKVWSGEKLPLSSTRNLHFKESEFIKKVPVQLSRDRACLLCMWKLDSLSRQFLGKIVDNCSPFIEYFDSDSIGCHLVFSWSMFRTTDFNSYTYHVNFPCLSKSYTGFFVHLTKKLQKNHDFPDRRNCKQLEHPLAFYLVQRSRDSVFCNVHAVMRACHYLTEEFSCLVSSSMKNSWENPTIVHGYPSAFDQAKMPLTCSLYDRPKLFSISHIWYL